MIKKLEKRIFADPKKVILKYFELPEERIKNVLNHIFSLNEAEIEETLNKIYSELDGTSISKDQMDAIIVTVEEVRSGIVE